MKALYSYQQEGKDMVYALLRDGVKKIIFRLQTGGGKSVVFTDLISEFKSAGLPVVLVMRRRKLITQASKHLSEAGISHGVYMAKHRLFRPQELVQVCSIDTLQSRGIYPHEGNDNAIIICDESQDMVPKSTKYFRLNQKYINNILIGFTATPFTDNSFFEAIVEPISAADLRDTGFLVPEITYVPSQIDVSGVKKLGGDYNEAQLFLASSKPKIIGDFVRDWKLYAQGRPTLLYGVNIEHSKMIMDAFRAEKINALHCDANTPDLEREDAIHQLKTGRIQILCNVNIFSVGVDIPEVSCIQVCRPTLSVVWHLQAIGRGLRTCPGIGKKDCIVIDNAGNTLRHGPVYFPRIAKLIKEKEKKPDGQDFNIKRCKQCGYIMLSHVTTCPICGFTNPVVPRNKNLKPQEGDLYRYEMSEAELEAMKRRSIALHYEKLCFIKKNKLRYAKDDWIYDNLAKKFAIPDLIKYGNEINLPEGYKWKT